jgi:hypothetical protein
VNPGFWLLKFNRTTLWSNPGCNSTDGINFPNCGLTFATQTDSNMGLLANALQSADPGELIFLVSAGVPVKSLTTSNAGSLGSAFEALGASQYTLNRLASATAPTFTLITSTDPNFSKRMMNGSVVVSSNQFTNQFQTGSVSGILSRDLHNLLRPVYTSQGDTQTSNSSVPYPLDYSFFQLVWQQPDPWTYLNSDAARAAYKYLSVETVMTVNQDFKPADLNPGDDDLHSLYTSTANAKLGSFDPTTIAAPANSTWQDPLEGANGVVYTIDPQLMGEIAQSLKSELAALSHVTSFEATLASFINGSDSTTMATILQAAAQAAEDLPSGSSAKTSVNYSNVLNLVGALVGIGAAVVSGPLAPMLAVLSGALWAAGSADVVNLGGGASTVPSPYRTLITDVGTLSGRYADFGSDLRNGLGVVMDNILFRPDETGRYRSQDRSGRRVAVPGSSRIRSFHERDAKRYQHVHLHANIRLTLQPGWLLRHRRKRKYALANRIVRTGMPSLRGKFVGTGRWRCTGSQSRGGTTGSQDAPGGSEVRRNVLGYRQRR